MSETGGAVGFASGSGAAGPFSRAGGLWSAGTAAGGVLSLMHSTLCRAQPFVGAQTEYKP